MGDWPKSKPPALPLFVSAGGYGHAWEIATTAAVGIGITVTTWVAKLVAYMPVALPFDYPVQRVWWLNGSTLTTSNADFGIYSWDGTKIYSTGSTAMSGTSAPQYVTPSPTFVLPADRYYFAWTCDNTTNRANSHGGSAVSGQMWGLLEETTGSFGLPATMTPVSWARAFGYVPCGITRTTTGF